MFSCAWVRLSLMLGTVLFAVIGICSNSDVFEEMQEAGNRVYARGLDRLPVLANRLLARDATAATFTVLTDPPITSTHPVIDVTETITLVATETNCHRCSHVSTETSSVPDPTVAQTTTGKPTVSGTATENPTGSVSATGIPTLPVAPTEEPSCSAVSTEPTSGPVPVPTEEPSCSAVPTEPTLGPVPTLTETTVSGTATGKSTITGTGHPTAPVASTEESSCSVVPTEPILGPIPETAAETIATRSSGSNTSATKETTGSSAGEHPGVPPSHTVTPTHIEITISIGPSQGGPTTLSTLITLATSRVESGTPTALHSSQYTQVSETETRAPKHTGESTTLTVSTPSPTYLTNGGLSSRKEKSLRIFAPGLLLLGYFIDAL